MAQRKKIVIIGAGSAQFIQGLFGDLIRSGRPWHLGLVDIDPSALGVADGLSRRMVSAKNADITIESSLDRCDVLPGADVVVLTIGVGGRKAWETDVHLPRKYGIYEPVGDTVMPGGISRALRMIPALVEITKDVQRLCPNALYINYSNPMTACCTGIRKATGADVVGCCIGTVSVQNMLARLIGAPEQEVTALAAGLNHFTWIWDLRWQGKDAWPLVREKLAAARAGKLQEPIIERNRFCFELFETYGAYAAVNDGHVTEFFPMRFPNGNYYGKVLGMGGAGDIDRHLAMYDAIYERMKGLSSGAIPMDDQVFAREGNGEHSQLIEMINAIEQDTRQVYVVNLPNRGAVPNLPPETVLEMTAVATAGGFRPVPQPDFPAPLAAALLRSIGACALTVEAALTGDRKLFVEALLTDGAVTERATAEKLAEDLIRAHKAHLPQFA